MEKLIDKANLIIGGAVAVLTSLFGVHAVIFACYFVLNGVDWLTGWIKARRNHTESSAAGLKGIVKKFLYWLLIGVTFLMSYAFTVFGDHILQVDLSIVLMLGWFTLATLTVNEVRSILENLVELGVDVPAFLTSGLAVVEKLINKRINIGNDESEEK